MNKKKPFAPRRREPTELHFFSSLSLEEAMSCIRQLASDYAIELEELDEDAYGFGIYYSGKHAANTGFVTGILRRWEGTYTRVDFDGAFGQSTPKQESKQSIETTSVMILLGLFGSILLIPVINIGALFLLGVFLL